MAVLSKLFNYLAVENYRWLKVQSLSVVHSGVGDIVQCISNICFRCPQRLGYQRMQMLIRTAPFYLQISQLYIPEFSYSGGLAIQRLSLCSVQVSSGQIWKSRGQNLNQLVLWYLHDGIYFPEQSLTHFFAYFPPKIFILLANFPPKFFFFLLVTSCQLPSHFFSSDLNMKAMMKQATQRDLNFSTHTVHSFATMHI